MGEMTPKSLLSSVPSDIVESSNNIEEGNVNIDASYCCLKNKGSCMMKMQLENYQKLKDAWLPITESTNGNAYHAAFHTICSGIGIQALLTPVAFAILGWTWGLVTLSLAFIWQLYTIWLLVQLHEPAVDGVRFSRYLQLFNATIGKNMGRLLAVFPLLYLSAGTCVGLIILGGSTSGVLFQILCGGTCDVKPLTPVQWYLVFTCFAIVLCQLPNLNSISAVSLVGAATGVCYCTIMWIMCVTEGRVAGVSYDRLVPESDTERAFFSTMNAIGLVAFAFRGHNLILEIQGTMPSNEMHRSHVPMWRGVRCAYAIVATCIIPVAITGYWAYGNMISQNGGMLTAIYQFRAQHTSKFILGLTSFLILINATSSFPIYAMPIFDHLEIEFTSKFHKACPWWLRSTYRVLAGFIFFFVAVAIPFLGSLAGLIGGLALPVTLAYPCFMWNAVKKPERYSGIWYINWGLGILGMVLSALVVAAGVWTVVHVGIKGSPFKPT